MRTAVLKCQAAAPAGKRLARTLAADRERQRLVAPAQERNVNYLDATPLPFRARRTTKSSLVRQCLEKSLAAPPAGGTATCYDLAQDLAGSVKGLPRDLATNPKYLEGLGR